jgi:glycine hydroxymethyltransferase
MRMNEALCDRLRVDDSVRLVAPAVFTAAGCLIKQDITGKDADAALGRANITVNKNAVPNDPRTPFVTSGLRIGTPAATTRGFGASEFADLTSWMCDILDDINNEAKVAEVKDKVKALCARFPVYR